MAGTITPAPLLGAPVHLVVTRAPVVPVRHGGSKKPYDRLVRAGGWPCSSVRCTLRLR